MHPLVIPFLSSEFMCHTEQQRIEQLDTMVVCPETVVTDQLEVLCVNQSASLLH